MPEETSPSSPNTLSAWLARCAAFIAGLSPRQKLVGSVAGAAVIVVILLATALTGGERVITINGYRLSQQEVAYLDMMAGGEVPSGNYWFNPQANAWGMVGNAEPMGQVDPYATMQDQGAAPQWGDVGQNYRGPFGDYMSDGQCSFVNGVPVGNC